MVNSKLLDKATSWNQSKSRGNASLSYEILQSLESGSDLQVFARRPSKKKKEPVENKKKKTPRTPNLLTTSRKFEGMYSVVTATRLNSKLTLKPSSIHSFTDSLLYHRNIEFESVVCSSPVVYVYRANCYNRKVCVKISRIERSEDLPVEAAVLWTCTGSGSRVPNLLHVFFLDGMCALVSDWVEGNSFAVPLRDLKSYALQLLSAVRCLHASGYFSRDIKPTNVLWDAQRRHLTLLDFDLAASTSAPHSLRVGTPGYLAPEIVANQPYDAKVDVYGCALTLLELYERSLQSSTELERVEFKHANFLRVIHRMLAAYDGTRIDSLEASVREADF